MTVKVHHPQTSSSTKVKSELKTHPWRLCPKGYHFIRTHKLRIPASKEHPEGQVVTRHKHCAKNPSHKDILSYDELKAISKKHFVASGVLTLGNLKEFPNSNKYDHLIIGWVDYWNKSLKPTQPLDPKLVKALMASESAFNEKLSNKTKWEKLGSAHGLMQIIDQTINALGNQHGELRDYLVLLSKKEILDPSANICAAARWLFQKKITAKVRQGHMATWFEAVAEYKGILEDYHAKEKNAVKVMDIFSEYYNILKMEK